ncbi:hypothetical protein PLICRDRAFT_88051 [Plicaturopsis crispa FD-325 SS-3]|nr:hypothetical protein PLICRDRAFT_88051 [Plicaturopsis crispa FD-325 SS-3]
MKTLHQRLNLFIDGNDAYTFVPAEPAGAQSLTIYRTTGDIVLNAPNTPVPRTASRYGKTIYGILGLISLSLSEYVIVLTGRELRGRLTGNDVYSATDFDILPLNPNVSVQYPPHPVEAHLLALIRSHLYAGLFLFSYGYDVTRRLQAQYASQEKDADKALWETADDRFFWNKFLQSRLIEASSDGSATDLSAFILPIMYGTFDIRPAFLHGRHLQFGLISRRSRYRAGTRYFRRGIDHEGHVANFNETEQLLFVESQKTVGQRGYGDFSNKLSFVQIRGSVPLFWAEINTLRYKPDLQIMDLQESADVMRLHLQEQISIYGEQTLVNLVNQKGYEKPVKEAYERYASQVNLPRVRYEYFDFHNECKHMRWDRISVLIDKIEDDLVKAGWFELDADKAEPVKRQEGVVRTNCMDNLDRTNVVQATLAKRTLNLQLRSLGILPEDASIDDYEAFSKDFREIWADHADLISKAYSGTGALKTDFTRTNERTKKGALEDGYKSILRYIKNNYFDGARQDAFDLVTGVWIPRKNPATALFLVTDSRPLLIRSMPYVTFFSLFMICAGLTLPRTSDYSLFYYFMLWFSLLVVSLVFIFIHGIEYVNWPRLLPPTDAIYYTGPGFRSGHKGKGLGKSGHDVGGKISSRVGTGAKWLANGRKRAGSHIEEIELGVKKRVD